MKLYITAGHEVHDGKGTGAHGFGDEAVEARRLAAAVITKLKKLDIPCETDNDSWSLREVINWLIGKTDKNSVCIDIHFNAAGPQITGTEIIIPDISTKKEEWWAKELVLTLARTLEIRNRGVKKEKDTFRKKIGILRQPKSATNLLLEICFITNREDMDKYNKKFNLLATEIACKIATLIHYGDAHLPS